MELKKGHYYKIKDEASIALISSHLSVIDVPLFLKPVKCLFSKTSKNRSNLIAVYFEGQHVINPPYHEYYQEEPDCKGFWFVRKSFIDLLQEVNEYIQEEMEL